MKTQAAYLRKIGRSIARISTAIVSGIPREQVLLKPRYSTTLQNRKLYAKPGSEKHYHRPMGKPAVEKQTLLKETKKAKPVP
jgi:hypothetical protein